MNRIFIFVLLLIVVSASGCTSTDHVMIGDKKISVEIADSPEEQKQGLMYRESLCPDCGMLFVFEREANFGFWMKNTLIPLDMVFINSELEIVDVLHADPCLEDPCQSYVPKDKALYVLEVNQGTFDNSVIGTRAVFD